MDTNFNQFFGMRQRPVFMSFTGVITHMEVAGGNMGNYDACAQMLTVENEAGNTVNFLFNPDTFVVDYATLYETMPVTVFYNGNAAAPLIYPPQYVAAVIAPQQEGQMVFEGTPADVITEQNLKTLYGIRAKLTLSEDGTYPVCTEYELE